MNDIVLHRCDEFCVCPIDGGQLLYAPASGEHACQHASCANAHGVSWDVLTRRWKVRR